MESRQHSLQGIPDRCSRKRRLPRDRSGTSVNRTTDRRIHFGGIMRKLRFGSNFAMFVLFFGLAALDAIKSNNLVRAAFWAAVGAVFLLADRRSAPTTSDPSS